MDETELINKLKYVLIQISEKNGNENELIEVLSFSEFKFKKHWNSQTFPNAYNIDIKVHPDVFAKHYNNINRYASIIKERINNSTKLIIDVLKILPDYEKI